MYQMMSIDRGKDLCQIHQITLILDPRFTLKYLIKAVELGKPGIPKRCRDIVIKRMGVIKPLLSYPSEEVRYPCRKLKGKGHRIEPGQFAPS